MQTMRADERRVPVGRILVVGAIGGVLAGMMMAMVEMIYGWLSEAHTLWDAPMGIWAWVFGLEHFGEPANHVWPVVLGMGAHMTNSMLIGIVFASLAFALRPGGAVASALLGMMYAFAIWAVMRYAVLPLNDGEAQLFTTDRVSPQWVWWLAHAALGVTAGLVYYVATRAAPEAGRQRRPEVQRAA